MKLDQPAWLLLWILLPMLGAGAVLTARLRRRQWSAFVAPRLRTALLKRGSPLPRWFALAFLLMACAALIGAMSRPKGEAGTKTEKSIGRNVLIALDLSRSMRVQDVKPDRLGQAKMVIYELLEAMPDERVGLIGFAGDAYVYAPLTVDHAAVRETVEQIDETWAPRGGSNLAEAVKLATMTLRNTGQRNNALVILSDGEKHEGDLEDMISEAEHSGVYILAVAVGTENGDYVPNPEFPSAGGRMVDRRGKPVVSRMQPEVMRKLAAETKGRFAIAGSGADIPEMVKFSIKDLDSFEIQGRERTVSIEFYQWLLLPGIVFLIASIVAGTRWRGVNPAVLAAGAVLAPTNAGADLASDAKAAMSEERYQDAYKAYQKLARDTKFEDRRARFHLGEALAAYRAGEFKRARSAYSQAMLSRDPRIESSAHAGLGNSLFQLGWRNLSDEWYPSDPSKLPDMESFDSLVRDRLAKLKENAEPGDEPATGYARMNALITNWSDAVRHYDSALASPQPDAAAKENRKLAMTYLKRLYELLEEDHEETEQSLPQPQPQEGEGQPQEGDGDSDDKKPGKKGEQGEPKDQGDDKKDQGKGGDDERKEDSKGGGKPDDKEDDSGKSKPKPDETPQDHARRKLKENSDLEKGPPIPGRFEFHNPEKDW